MAALLEVRDLHVAYGQIEAVRGFLRNPRHPRNSVVFWLHVEKPAAVARWGESALVRFS